MSDMNKRDELREKTMFEYSKNYFVDMHPTFHFSEGFKAGWNAYLAEPSPGDLERVVKAYAEVRQERDELANELNSHSKLLEISAQILKERDSALAAVGQLREATQRLRNEAKGMLSAHEQAIRQDSGNTNWQCLQLTVEQAEHALAATSGFGEGEK